MRRSSQMRRNTIRSIVRWTEKLRSRCDSFGFRNARFRARSARHFSISLRNASSTSAVPRFALVDSANLSNDPFRIASRAKIFAMSSHRDFKIKLAGDESWRADYPRAKARVRAGHLVTQGLFLLHRAL